MNKKCPSCENIIKYKSKSGFWYGKKYNTNCKFKEIRENNGRLYYD